MERHSRWRTPRLASAVAVVAGAVLGVALAPGSASAHFNSGLYSHEYSDCASRINPIGAVFYGDNYVYAGLHVQHHAGWSETIIEGEQYFATHGICYEQNTAVADDDSWNDRNHMRMRQTYDSDPSLGVTTVGTPHWEEVVTCRDGGRGHAVTPNGFYDARELLIDYMWMDHPYYYEYWGNTQTFVQCNDWEAAGDGVVVYVFIG